MTKDIYSTIVFVVVVQISFLYKYIQILFSIPFCTSLSFSLDRAAEEMLKKGIDPDSPEAQLFGRKLLRALTDVFGRCILETGFFHAGKLVILIS